MKNVDECRLMGGGVGVGKRFHMENSIVIAHPENVEKLFVGGVVLKEIKLAAIMQIHGAHSLLPLQAVFPVFAEGGVRDILMSLNGFRKEILAIQPHGHHGEKSDREKRHNLPFHR